jgi:hypothetical protein
MRTVLFVLLLLATAPALADHYRSATLAPDRSALTLHTDHGERAAPRNDPNQQGFDDPHISPDGQMAGWLMLEGNCCASYPLPTELVLFRDGRIVRQFTGDTVIWAWAFSSDGKAVAWRERTAHGASSIIYHLHRIADGAELAQFACNLKPGTPVGEPLDFVHPGRVPAWVWPIADEDCPTR